MFIRIVTFNTYSQFPYKQHVPCREMPLLMGGEKFSPLFWQSRRIRRVVRSTLAGETDCEYITSHLHYLTQRMCFQEKEGWW